MHEYKLELAVSDRRCYEHRVQDHNRSESVIISRGARGRRRASARTESPGRTWCMMRAATFDGVVKRGTKSAFSMDGQLT